MNEMHCKDNFTHPVFMDPSGVYPSKFLATFYCIDGYIFTLKIFYEFSTLFGA
jgi:hypothetical protein